METNRDKAAGSEGPSSISLRYSRQFQSGGHMHTIDAEAALAVGSSPEKREQIIRELELNVEQLARQVAQRAARPAGEIQPQAPARPVLASKTSEPPTQFPRPLPAASQPTAPLPISESMPATPISSGERTISLPYFIDFIKKRWNMSAQEAMELLDVRELSGLNLREALFKLRTIKEPDAANNSVSTQARARSTQPHPIVETPSQANRPMPMAPDMPPQASTSAPNTAPISRAQISTALQHEASRATPAASGEQRAYARAPEPKLPAQEQERESRPDFAGSAKAPLPIQLGVVREMATRPYSFEEEEEEEGDEEYELPDDSENNTHRQAAEGKLEELKGIRGDKASSPERLNVLNNVLDGQISEEQLQHLLKIVWNLSSKKRLKVQQVEALISWAKEDYFVDEVENLLALVDPEEEE
ncbi:MAG TPA: hypothetical protein VGD98_23830 [Ktedonobacteraceae bacterium]